MTDPIDLHAVYMRSKKDAERLVFDQLRAQFPGMDAPTFSHLFMRVRAITWWRNDYVLRCTIAFYWSIPSNLPFSRDIEIVQYIKAEQPMYGIDLNWIDRYHGERNFEHTHNLEKVFEVVATFFRYHVAQKRDMEAKKMNIALKDALKAFHDPNSFENITGRPDIISFPDYHMATWKQVANVARQFTKKA